MTKNKTPYFLIFQVTGWGIFSLINLLFTYLYYQQILIPDVAYGIFIFILGISLSNFIRWVFKYFGWLNQGIGVILHKLVILSLGVAVINVIILYLLSSLAKFYEKEEFEWIKHLKLVLSFGSVYFVWGILYFSIYFFRNFKKEEILNLQIKAQMTEIHLNKLKSQLNPHFMFNAMNVLRALIDEDKNKAKQGITQLSNILRHTLNINQQKLINIKEELQLVKDYLSLEKLRFEERLNFSIDISEKHLQYFIPPMLLQTLVENAIKHGISKIIAGGTISITSIDRENEISIEIRNSGTYNPDGGEDGYGLINSRERLAYIYNGKAHLDIKNSNQNEVITIITIPKNSKND